MPTLNEVCLLAPAAAGLLLPGYLFARRYGLPCRWGGAFAFSTLLLAKIVIVSSCLRLPLSPVGIGMLLAAVCLVLARPGRVPLQGEAQASPQRGGRSLRTAAVMAAAIVAVLIAVRAILFPLSGFDTYFRWDGLARAMFEYGTLEYYPPVSASDFAIYVFPDGIPPLVAGVYWWCYAVLGRPVGWVTFLPVVLQYLALLALIFAATELMFGRSAAWMAMIAATSSSLLAGGVAIGQETGYTALSVVGQLYFAALAGRNPAKRWIVATALFAVLGGLAREYGPALSVVGAVALAWQPASRRYLPFFVGLVSVCTAPWYLRNWILTGNPLYAHAIPGGFRANPVYAAILEYYKEYRSFNLMSAALWGEIFLRIMLGAPLLLVVGASYAILKWRDTGPLLCAIAIVTGLWLISIGQTAGGGIYSLRVLTPALATLSIAAGGGLAAFHAGVAGRGLVRQGGLWLVLLTSFCYAATATAAHPFPAQSVVQAFASTASDPPEFCEVQPILAEALEKSRYAASGVLTDDMYLATLLQRRSRFRPVMIWSPEVAFVFNGQLSPVEKRNKLVQQGIPLVVIDNGSPNTLFLMRHPFFQEYRDWQLVFSIPERAAIFQLESTTLPPGRVQ